MPVPSKSASLCIGTPDREGISTIPDATEWLPCVLAVTASLADPVIEPIILLYCISEVWPGAEKRLRHIFPPWTAYSSHSLYVRGTPVHLDT